MTRTRRREDPLRHPDNLTKSTFIFCRSLVRAKTLMCRCVTILAQTQLKSFILEQFDKRFGQSVGVIGWYENPVLAVFDNFRDAARRGCNHWFPKGHCFENDDSEGFTYRRQHKNPATSQ